MRTTAVCAVFMFAVAGTGLGSAADGHGRSQTAPILKVVELYTSQGCSACPEADTLVGKLSRRPDVLALTFNVDYWDFMGWKDTLAAPGNARRQRDYSERFNLRYVYTPQIVVQGAFQATGSDQGAIDDQLTKTEGGEIPVSMLKNGDALVLQLPKMTLQEDVRLIVAAFDKKHTTVIKAGENQGKTLTYFNVVRKMTSFGTWRGEAKAVTVPWEPGSADTCAVLLQSAVTGRILGAAEMPW